MIGRMFQRRGNQLVEVTNPSVILADISNLVQGSTAPVYVNAGTGDDVNDGMTTNTAVKTIGKALELAANRGVSDTTNSTVQVFIAEGTYNEDVSVAQRVNFVSQGDIVINGRFFPFIGGVCRLLGTGSFTVNGLCRIVDSAYLDNRVPFTVNGQVLCWRNSVFNSYALLTVNFVTRPEMGIHALTASASSTIRIEAGITITGSGISSVVLADASSTIDFAAGALNINSVADWDCFASTHGSTINLHTDISSITINGVYPRAVASAFTSGSIAWSGAAPAASGTPNGKRFEVASGGNIGVGGLGINRIPGSQPGTVDAATFGYYG